MRKEFYYPILILLFRKINISMTEKFKKKKNFF